MDGAFAPFAPPFAPFLPASSRGEGFDGSFDFLPRADRRVSGAAPAPPAFTPSLDFSDARNSQYALLLFLW